MQFIKHFSEIEEGDHALVGGKGLNLGKLTRAGFQVPQGFCITTDAYRRSVKNLSEQNASSVKEVTLETDLIEAIQTAHEELQTDTVAVRSSATAEDLETASFAGQQDSYLNVISDDLLEAVKACWASLWSDRAIAYRRTQSVNDEGLAMAVVVQEMFQSDVSGVLFTVSPFNENASIVESNWGLGESVVSGEITPDSFQISRETGEVLERTIAIKREMIISSGISDVSTEQQEIPSLTDSQLEELTQLGMQVERLYEQPMDIEWALADAKFVLLQARPITTYQQEQVSQNGQEIAKLREHEIEKLKSVTDTRGTIWSHHNLAEVLPAPLPMTWSIMQRFMSGRGGLGKAYRDLGFRPSKRVDKLGILDLICGRIYVNLNRESELFFEGFPYAHDFDELKMNPQKAMYAQATLNIKHSTFTFWLKLPLYIMRLTKAEMRLRKFRESFDQELTEEIFPKFQQDVLNEQNLDYTKLSDDELVTKFEEWCEKTLDVFAPKALIATVLAGFSLQRLEVALQKCVDAKAAKNLVSSLISGNSGNLTVETNERLSQVGKGELTLSDFLKDYGHRAVNEFELSQPRWREDTSYLEQIIASLSKDDGGTPEKNQQFDRQIELQEKAQNDLNEILEKKKGVQKQVESELELTKRYMPYRETAKFYLMLGYEQIRRTLVELDKRYKLNEGIFYLTPKELSQLINGKDFNDVITERKEQRELLLQIPLQDVIFSDSLESIGTPSSTETADTYTGVGVSAGVASGKARVLLNPSEIRPDERDYILVCPSTDPAWTPLFVHAAGLVMERGGLLSHGAVVAREYGVPAVANIINATENIVEGQMIQVDGKSGKVSVLTETS